MTELMFIRFVIGLRDSDSGRRQGLFQAGGEVAKQPDLTQAEIDAIDELRSWFGVNLPVPTRFSHSGNARRKGQAISWYRVDASEYINRMREYQRLLEAHDVPVEVLLTDRPGYIVYEDDYQVAAIPFADTPC